MASKNGFYGNAVETFYVCDKGIFVIQSPDLVGAGRDYLQVYKLPFDTERLSDDACADLDTFGLDEPADPVEMTAAELAERTGTTVESWALNAADRVSVHPAGPKLRACTAAGEDIGDITPSSAELRGKLHGLWVAAR